MDRLAREFSRTLVSSILEAFKVPLRHGGGGGNTDADCAIERDRSCRPPVRITSAYGKARSQRGSAKA
jgi:hypothetical protein